MTKLPEQLFFLGGGVGEDRKMFLKSIQTLAMIEKILTVQLLTSQGTNENCLAVIGIKNYQSIDFDQWSLRASIQNGVFFIRKS